MSGRGQLHLLLVKTITNPGNQTTVTQPRVKPRENVSYAEGDLISTDSCASQLTLTTNSCSKYQLANVVTSQRH